MLAHGSSSWISVAGISSKWHAALHDQGTVETQVEGACATNEHGALEPGQPEHAKADQAVKAAWPASEAKRGKVHLLWGAAKMMAGQLAPAGKPVTEELRSHGCNCPCSRSHEFLEAWKAYRCDPISKPFADLKYGCDGL